MVRIYYVGDTAGIPVMDMCVDLLVRQCGTYILRRGYGGHIRQGHMCRPPGTAVWYVYTTYGIRRRYASWTCVDLLVRQCGTYILRRGYDRHTRHGHVCRPPSTAVVVRIYYVENTAGIPVMGLCLDLMVRQCGTYILRREYGGDMRHGHVCRPPSTAVWYVYTA